MKLFEKYEKCYGLSLPSIGKFKLELWFCLPNYQIKPHTHPNQDIKLIFLFGHNIKFHRKKVHHIFFETFCASFIDIFKVFNIRRGDAHYFSVSKYPLIFLNIEKWYIKPTSAAKDLQLT